MDSGDIVKKLPKALVNQPFELLMSALLALSSLTILLGYGDPRSLHQLGPSLVPVYLWASVTLGGSFLIMAGLVISARAKTFPGLYRAHNIERLGLIMQGTAAILYGLASYFLAGRQAVVGGTILLGIGGVNGIRYLILSGSVQLLKRSRATLEESDEPA